MSYAELSGRTQAVANVLLGSGVGAAEVVAFEAGLTIEAVVSLLGIMRAGAAYLPLDPQVPLARNEAILRDAGVTTLLVERESANRLTGPRGCRLIDLDLDSAAPAGECPPRNLEAGQLAYVLYTSGSNGAPKGVAISRGNLDHYLGWADATYPSGGAGSLLPSPLFFDLSVTGLFLPLMRGETVTLLDGEADSSGLARTLESGGPFGIVKVTPSALRLLDALMGPGTMGKAGVSSLIVGGEALFYRDLRRWFAESPDTRIFNEYGPTETTVGVVCFEAGPDSGPDSGPAPVPIGRPIDGVGVAILDEAGDEVRGTGSGELVVTGPTVSPGYIGPQPEGEVAFGRHGTDRSYRTGDHVRQREDGELVYEGRLDDQIKLSGHRIEPSEIESALRDLPGVGDAAAALAGTGGSDQRLVAFVVVAGGDSPPAESLRAELAETLPGYMVPSAIHRVGRIPRNANGKADRAALIRDTGEKPPPPESAGGDSSEPDPAVPAGETDLAIVGFDCNLPEAPDPERFWQLLKWGREAVREFSDEELRAAGVPAEQFGDARYIRRGGVLRDIDVFDAQFFDVSAAEAALMDPQHRLLMHAVWRSLEHAGHGSRTDRRRTGLFAGVSANTYLYTRILPRWEEVGASGTEFQLLLASEKDFAATRISYELDLRGPGVGVQTGCSTGLVAVHQAGRSLLAGECDLAVAAAACVRVPHHAGVTYREGGIFSPRGLCAAFDAGADGCVQGNGVVAVVLRRLEDALRDGDTVYAVLKGSAINNDGRGKAGFAAPGVNGQREVIEMAQAVAGVTPDQISYVEAHGTGTRLGDPIECEALSQAFGSRGGGQCRIGSVKTNLGHLDTAAGLAGLLKTVLALHHRQLPPSLHFDRLNPAIAWGENGGFEIQNELESWPADGPRIAGVSAFGVGGTNAHAVVAEAPSVPRPEPAPPAEPGPQCFVLSSSRKDDLPAMAENLAGHLEKFPALDPADVAFTLQEGRAAFRYRLAIVAADFEALAGELRSPELAERIVEIGDDRADRVATEDPAEAARAWTAGSAVDWTALHSGRRRVRVALPGIAFRKTRFWVADEAGPAPAADPRTRPGDPVRKPSFYLPQWEFSGDLRQAVPPEPRSESWLFFGNGSPIGERLVEALRERNQTVHVVRCGGKFEALGPLEWTVGNGASDYPRLLSAIESADRPPGRIVHAWQLGEPEGDPLDSEAFGGELARGLQSLLRLGQALATRDGGGPVHLDILTESQFDLAGTAPPSPARAASLGPALVFPQEIPNLTARLLDVGDPPSSDPAGPLAGELLEARRGCFCLRGFRRYRRILSPAAPGAVGDPSGAGLREGAAWLVSGGFGGVGFELAKALAGHGPKLVLIDRPRREEAPRIDLLREQVWLRRRSARLIEDADAPLIHADATLVERLNGLSSASIFSCLEAMSVSTAAGRRTTGAELAESLPVVPKFRRMLSFMIRSLAADGIVGREGDSLTFTGKRPGPVEAARRAVVERAPDLEGLMDLFTRCVDHLPEILRGNCEATSVLYPQGSEALMERAAQILMRRSIGSVLAELLAEWIARLARQRPKDRPLRILEFGAGNGLLTEKVLAALDRAGCPAEYWITDIGKTFVAKALGEFSGRPGVAAASLDISRDPRGQGFAQADFDLAFGLNVVHATRDVRESLVQLRGLLAPGGALVLLESVKEERWVDLVAGLAEGWWIFDDCYRTDSPLLDAGGWGRALADAGFADVSAVGGDPGEGETMDCALIVSRRPPGGSGLPAAKQRQIEELEALGARVHTVEADLRDPVAVRLAVEAARAEAGPIHGLVHCAAAIRGGLVRNLTDETAADEMGAKARGALHLLRELDNDPLEWCLLSSSLNVHFGGEGQSVYVAANAVLAALADAVRRPGRRVVVIDWDRWQDTGFARTFQEAYRDVRGEALAAGTSPAEAVKAFRRILGGELPQVALSAEPFEERYAAYLATQRDRPPAAAAAEGEPGPAEPAAPVAGADRGKTGPSPLSGPAAGAFESQLLELCRELLGEGDIEAADKLMDVGADSIVVLQLQAEIESLTGLRIHTAALMGQTIEQLAVSCADPAGNPATVEVIDRSRIPSPDDSAPDSPENQRLQNA